MSRNSYAVSWQRKTICCETANRRSREKEGRGVNMNKSEQEREINELFLARAMIRFASLLHRAKFGRVAVNMSYYIDLSLIKEVCMRACVNDSVCVCVCVCVN